MAKKAKGLGDSIEQITEATGIKKAVELFSSITGIDCGCEERKQRLNEIFRYRKTECLNEMDYNYLKEFFSKDQNELVYQQQVDLARVYKNIFGTDLEMSNCAGCWRDYISQIRQVYNLY